MYENDILVHTYRDALVDRLVIVAGVTGVRTVAGWEANDF